jgi:hypothetical protein
MIEDILLGAILLALLGVLGAVKTGFNQVIAGLEALAERDRQSPS